MPQNAAAVYRIRVAVPVHLYDSFDYSLSAAQYAAAQLGARVMVPFGRQQLLGIVVEKIAPDEPYTASFPLKNISTLLDDASVFSEHLWTLLLWTAQYYHFPLGEVLHAALPTLLRQGKPCDVLEHLWFAEHIEDALTTLKRAPKQLHAYQILQLHSARC